MWWWNGWRSEGPDRSEGVASLRLKPGGVIPPHVTPFTPGGELDEEGLRRDVDFWIESGVHGLVPCGSNGEAVYMSREERGRVIEVVLDQANGRVPVLAGTGSAGTRQAVELTRDAADLGVDGVVVVTPYYFRPSQEEVYRYYRDVAEAVDVPVVLYNVPKFTGLNLEPGTAERLAEVGNVVGIKDSSGDMRQIQELIRSVGDRISVLAGTGNMIYPTLASGGHGAVVAVANVAPSLAVKIFEAFKAGDHETARETQMRIVALNDFLTRGHGIPAVKAALDMMGKAGGYPRRPLTPLDGDSREELRGLLGSLGLV